MQVTSQYEFIFWYTHTSNFCVHSKSFEDFTANLNTESFDSEPKLTFAFLLANYDEVMQNSWSAL